MNEREREIQQYIDSQDTRNSLPNGGGKEVYDRRFLSKLLISLEKAVNKNSEMRFRYKSDPSRFYESEKSLYDAIRALSIISETDLYIDLEKSTDSIETLLGLITHENIMIGTQVLQIFGELFDPGNEVVEAKEMSNLAEVLIDQGLASQIHLFLDSVEKEAKEQIKSVERGEMKPEDVFEGFQEVLNLVTSVMTNNYKTGLRLVRKAELVNWLSKRFTRDVDLPDDQEHSDLQIPPRHSKYQLAEFCAELFITVPESVKIITNDLVDMFLLELAALRKITPANFLQLKGLNKENIDFFRDIFDALIASLRFSWTNQAFLDLEGIQLMLLLIQQFSQKEYKEIPKLGKKVEWIRRKALEVIVESTRGYDGTAKGSCEDLVAADGIKILFSLLKKVSSFTSHYLLF